MAVKKETSGPLAFGALIREHRKKVCLSQRELADRMNVTRNTIINWEADKSRPDYSLVPRLCALLNIQVHELFNMPGEIGLSELEERIIGNLRQLDPSSRRVVDKMISTMLEEELLARDNALKNTFAIFLQRPGSVAAGFGSDVPEETPEYVFLRKNHINARADGIVLVSGNSMEPVYHCGDCVYYAQTSAADPGEDVIVDTDDGAVIKRIASDRTLYSVNPDIPYPVKSDQNRLVIRGRVLGVVSSSDRPAREDAPLLEELFADEIRAFYEKYGMKNWE